MSLFQNLETLIKALQNKGWKKYAKIGSLVIFVWFVWTNRARKHPTIRNRDWFLPIIGHLHFMLGLIPLNLPHYERMNYRREEYLKYNVDTVHMSRFGKFSVVRLFDPKLIKFVFEDRFDDFIKSDMIRDRLCEVLGDGIFASDGDIWRKHRKIGSKMFSMRNLKNYMFQVAQSGNKRWMNKIEELRQTKNEIDIHDLFAIYTLDVFVEIAFGSSLQIIEAIPKLHPFSIAFDSALNLLLWRFRVPFFQFFKYFGIGYEAKIKQHVCEINRFANEMIESVKQGQGKLTDETGHGQHNILSLFLEDNPNLTKNELKDIAMNFIIAGRDTTRILLSWFFYEISLPHNQTIKDKIVAEIDNFYQHEKELTYKNIQNYYGTTTGQDSFHNRSYFKYLEAALLETLRIHPAVPVLLRFAVRDVRLPNGHIINKGTGVVADAFMQAYNKKLWGQDARTFKPERFIDKGLKSFEPHKYLAFNIAPRLCLGRHVALMEAKLVTIKLLQKYDFEAMKNQKVVPSLNFVLNMEYGFKVHLYPRNNT